MLGDKTWSGTSCVMIKAVGFLPESVCHQSRVVMCPGGSSGVSSRGIRGQMGSTVPEGWNMWPEGCQTGFLVVVLHAAMTRPVTRALLQ